MARPIAANFPRDRAGLRRSVDQLQQARRAGIERMEAVAVARHVADALLGERIDLGRDRRVEVAAARRHRVVERHRLLAGAAMHVAQHVDRRRHGVVDVDAAAHRHAGGGDRRRLRAVIDRRDQRRLQQLRGLRMRQLAARHQIDHLGEARAADQVLDGIAAQADHAGLHVDDRGRPPVFRRFRRIGFCHGRFPRSLCRATAFRCPLANSQARRAGSRCRRRARAAARPDAGRRFSAGSPSAPR